MADEKLKVCPFCEGEAELREANKGQAGCFDPIYAASCMSCGCRTDEWFDSPQEAIAEWNTRTPDPELSALREKVRSLEAVKADHFRNASDLAVRLVKVRDENWSLSERVKELEGALSEQIGECFDDRCEMCMRHEAILSNGASRDE